MNNKNAWIDLLVRYSKSILLLNLLLVAAVAYGLKYLYFEADYKIFFEKDDPKLVAEELLQATYGKSDNILFVIDPTDGVVFSPTLLPVVERLTELAWQIPHSQRVDSLTNYQYPRAEGDDIFIEDLIQESATYTREQIEAKKRIALNEIGLVGRLISPSAEATAVNVTLNLPERGSTAQQEAMISARELAALIEAENPNLSIYLAGVTPTEQTFSDVVDSDSSKLFPIMFALVLVLLATLLRSVAATVCTVVIIILAVLVGMGFAGWTGMAINNVNVSAPNIIMTLAIADCVHIFNSFLNYFSQGRTKSEALAASLKLNIYPVFLTSVTTAFGFLTMNFSESPPFQQLGTIAAAGTLGALWAAVFILPGLIQLMPFKRDRKPVLMSGLITPFSNFVIRNHNGIFFVALGLILLVFTALPRIELNDDPIGYFSENIPVRQASEFVDDHLSGTQVLYYSLDAGSPDGILDPGFLQSAAAFTDWLRSQEEVVNVESLTDTLKRLNQILHGDDPDWHRLPDERVTAAQYYLMYELSLPYGLDPGNQVGRDKSAIRIAVTLENQRSLGLIAFEQKAHQWFMQHAPELASEAASYSVSFAHIGQRNLERMISGSLVAIVLISLSLILTFRSFRYGMLSFIPNLFPALITLGIWVAFVGEVNMAASVVFSLTLGIVVDDTVHFMVKYIDARRHQGSSVEDSVRYALSTVGPALLSTSIVLAAGFAVLGLSDFTVNATAGKLVATTISIAVLMDLLFLPALLLKLGRR